MASFLKRITSTQNLNKVDYTNIPFNLDEPDFNLIQKFNVISRNQSTKSNNKMSKLKVCNTCGNTEFSYKAKFCKVCGSEVRESPFYYLKSNLK